MKLSLFLGASILVLILVAAMALLARRRVLRIVSAILAFLFAGFCGFGYLASFELSSSPFGSWQLIYGALGIVSIGVGVAALVARPRAHRGPRSET